MAPRQNSSSMPPAPHGGDYEPGQTGSATQEQHYEQPNVYVPHGGDYDPGQAENAVEEHYERSDVYVPHGGDYDPGQARNAAQEQGYVQPSSPSYGGDSRPSIRRKNISRDTPPGPATQEHMAAAQPAAWIGPGQQHQHQHQHQHQQQQYQQQHQQQNFNIQPQPQPYQAPQHTPKEQFMESDLELGGTGSGTSGAADMVVRDENHYRQKYQRGYGNISHQNSKLRWEYPNYYQVPGLKFVSTTKFRHRDILQRETERPEEDMYISPADGSLKNLVVQTTQDIYDGAPNSTWRRTFIRNTSPIHLRIANFAYSDVPADPRKWDGNDLALVAMKWIPVCIGLMGFLLWNPNGAEGQFRNGGWYDAFNYHYWGYPKTARNFYESPDAAHLLPHGEANNSLTIQRVLGPRYLCFLKEPSESKMCGITTRLVDRSTADTPYIFIAYTAEQFKSQDFDDLHDIAEKAARKAKVPAYWVGCSCMRDRDQVENDVYRISDVIRGAQSLVIAIGPSRKRPELQTADAMLKVWGERMWTLPEALLSPADKDITIYVRGDSSEPWVISKKQFAATAWDDPLISRQLVDHYNKTLDLSRLELVLIALNCLRTRNTTEYLPGDVSYALMGLLRQRPQVDKTDSDFQAFARLSLANDSDGLIERLICMLPKDQRASWLAMDDAWNVNLWDIYPKCQVAGIGHDNTIILDGAYGAAIRWKAFARVRAVGAESWRRLGARAVVHGAPLYFVIGVALVANAGTSHIYLAIGAILVVFSLVVILASPYLMRIIYSGKLWNTQPWFFGFEGYLDLPTIELQIFGASSGRLKWSPSGSSISKHEMNEHGECIGVDPTLDPRVKEMVRQAQNCNYGDMRVFTLVDTYRLTATMFLAVRPPVAALLCGHEGGMQRAVMCSYDWKTQTLYRETVLRMDTPVLEKMFRVNRFRFGLQRPLSGVHAN